MTQPITVAIVGAGGRGRAYGTWIAEHPDRAQVVAVADPRDDRRAEFAAKHGIPAERQFTGWQELHAAGQVATAATITTQDKDHLAPAVALAQQGYHLLLEKPIAPTAPECVELVDAVQGTGVLAAVCHVLRYTPYTDVLKNVIDAGRIGEIVDVQHLEPVGYWHIAHSYVRGNWRNEGMSSSMLLSKSCHDIDWLRYLVGRPIERVSSFGSLTHFRVDRAPAGAGERCTDCVIEPSCPYSAVRIYGRRGLPDGGLDGQYGRCVYRCDNDVVDHQVVNLEFAGGVTSSVTICGFTKQTHRQTRVHGTHGSAECDGEIVTVYDFLTEQTERIDVPPGESGHGGGDAGLMTAFTETVATGDRTHIRSGLLESLETHLAVFAAEAARHRRTVEEVGHATS